MTSINFQGIRRFGDRRVIVIGLMCVILWLIHLAFSWGLADLFADQARHDMDLWEEKKGLVKTETWQLTVATLDWAQFFEPNHPDFLESLAKVNYLLYRYGLTTAADREMALQQALDYYLKAAQQRPVSPYAWANIAIVKYQLKQYDTQFFMAIENAAILGPHEPFVQRAIADIGLDAWYKLPKPKQSIVLATVERGMHKQAKLMNTFIKKHRRENVMCVYSRQKTAFAHFCR